MIDIFRLAVTLHEMAGGRRRVDVAALARQAIGQHSAAASFTLLPPSRPPLGTVLPSRSFPGSPVYTDTRRRVSVPCQSSCGNSQCPTDRLKTGFNRFPCHLQQFAVSVAQPSETAFVQGTDRQTMSGGLRQIRGDCRAG